ncbi:ABC transporter permease subunit [Streptomyces sp. SID13031]|nr:ABC transporter permease subunit [Streptomyces sp. SID13031]
MAVNSAARRLVALAVALGIWQLASIWLGAATLPGVGPCLAALGRAGATAELWRAVWDTMSATLLGLAIAVIVAVPLGAVLGSVRFAGRSSQVVVDVLRTIPPVTLLPLALLLYGPTLQMALTLVIYGAFWPLLIHGIYAVREVDPVQRDVAISFRLPALLRWRKLLLPSILPMTIVGIRISATIALLLALTSELIGGAPGIGERITAAQLTNRVDDAYAYIICAALLGVATNAAMRLIERRVISWHPSVRQVGAAR